MESSLIYRFVPAAAVPDTVSVTPGDVVEVTIVCGGITENICVRVTFIRADGTILGRLGSKPIGGSALTYGSVIVFGPEHVTSRSEAVAA